MANWPQKLKNKEIQSKNLPQLTNRSMSAFFAILLDFYENQWHFLGETANKKGISSF